ncbi:class III lanthionine synthetase LanKC [Streptomyces sp. NPDC059166]|uniref:class III lanthionine synthetase LanKC n=1 Tax=Streptomyces sp. NPDC059166 TaxID=3346752 RepID=UPI00367A7217
MQGTQEPRLYCLADRTYYDTPARLADEGSRYPLDTDPPPAGWRREAVGLWTSLVPEDGRPAEQGWKIHVSTVPDEAAATLRDTARICFTHGVPFKFLRSEKALLLMADKHMNRSGAGKFIAVYPPDDAVFATLAGELSRTLSGRRGPYVLSDLRIADAPVYTRYGAYVPRWCTDGEGRRVLALRDPSGRLVPDERGVVFRTPAWVEVPEFLRPHLAARAAARDDGFPYTVTEALQFSNAGGIYLAEHRETGRRVVLREARPHCGLDAAGDDAVTRLHREHRALTALAGLDCVPAVYGLRTVWEHEFLIEEHIEGNTLLEEIVDRFSLVRGAGSPDELAPYVAWADTVVRALAAALEQIHTRGLRFGDLHPSNIIVRPDGGVTLVDFEYATALDDEDTPLAGAQGLQAPPGTPGAQADAYALWATWLTMLMPVTEMAGLERAKALTLERWARRRYGLPADAGPPRPALLDADGGSLRREAGVAALFEAPGVDWTGIRAGLLAGIHAGASPGRADRLFPGGPDLFTNGGTDLRNGAAGVLYALHRVGAPAPEEWTDWLADTALRGDPAPPGGLFDGPAGTALVLALLGRPAEGRELWDRAVSRAAPAVSADLLTGRAGVALAALRLARLGHTGPDGPLLDTALRTARDLDRLVRGETVEGLRLPESAGLLSGLSGVALLHLELHGLTGEAWLRDAARTALLRDASHLVTMPDGTVQVKDGRRHLLYLGQGSSGVALVAQAWTAHHEDPVLSALIPGVAKGCAMEFVREPGLFTGRAGLAAAAAQLGPSPRATAPVLASVRNLAWHLVADEDRLFVPGSGLRRFSADLATGSAGLLLALHHLSAEEDAPGLLDLLTLG